MERCSDGDQGAEDALLRGRISQVSFGKEPSRVREAIPFSVPRSLPGHTSVSQVTRLDGGRLWT
jgi:hypothetical protein